jgi:hypothetical protein
MRSITMADNPFGIIDPLSDIGERDALDKTPAPHTLRDALNETATVGYVQRYVGTHQRWCPALRVLRRWSMFACVLLGMVLVLNVWGLVSAKAVFQTAVQEGVRQELKALGIMHARALPVGPPTMAVTP